MGAGPKPANTEELAVIQQGSKAWNEWRNNNKQRASFNLSNADLQGRDLTGTDLRGVDLSNGILRGATLGQGTKLWNANLSNADLYQTNFRGADLQDVNFSNADLHEADLRESNLQGADLSSVKGGLLSRQLAGSNLTGAKLPEPLAKLYDSLSSVKEISDSAQKLFLALLAGCLYSWLTIAQTTDVELITNRATTPLPIIQAAIPIVGFYVVAPLILLCLYFYFHFYLQKLWEELGSLPAVFTDGRELHKRTDPWLLNDLVRSHFTKLKDGRPFLSYFQAWVSVVLAWWLAPITLFAFWLRFLRRHDLVWTILQALLLALCITSAVALYRLAQRTLRGSFRHFFSLMTLLKRPSSYLRVAIGTSVPMLTILVSLGALFGEPHNATITTPRTWIPWCLRTAGYRPFANLSALDISTKPPDWSDSKPQSLGAIRGADLSGTDLRHAMVVGAFLVKANLNFSHLEDANLIDADLRLASLSDSNLRSVLFWRASLQDAYLRAANLESAVLFDSKLDRADLQWANLENADLGYAELKEAEMMHANLEKSDLYAARLNGADLTNADLAGANVRFADFRSDQTSGTGSLTIGLTKDMILSSKNWQMAFYDPDMLKQLGLPPDHNEKLQKQMEAEQQQAKPAATTTATPK